MIYVILLIHIRQELWLRTIFLGVYGQHLIYINNSSIISHLFL